MTNGGLTAHISKGGIGRHSARTQWEKRVGCPDEPFVSIRDDFVMRPSAVTRDVNEPDLLEDAEVMRYGRLRQVEMLGQVAHAHRTSGTREHREQRRALRIGNSAE